jgi:hypothetical protein
MQQFSFRAKQKRNPIHKTVSKDGKVVRSIKQQPMWLSSCVATRIHAHTTISINGILTRVVHVVAPCSMTMSTITRYEIGWVGPSRGQSVNLQMLPGRQTKIATLQTRKTETSCLDRYGNCQTFPGADFTITLSTAKRWGLLGYLWSLCWPIFKPYPSPNMPPRHLFWQNESIWPMRQHS